MTSNIAIQSDFDLPSKISFKARSPKHLNDKKQSISIKLDRKYAIVKYISEKAIRSKRNQSNENKIKDAFLPVTNISCFDDLRRSIPLLPKLPTISEIMPHSTRNTAHVVAVNHFSSNNCPLPEQDHRILPSSYSTFLMHGGNPKEDSNIYTIKAKCFHNKVKRLSIENDFVLPPIKLLKSHKSEQKGFCGHRILRGKNISSCRYLCNIADIKITKLHK